MKYPFTLGEVAHDPKIRIPKIGDKIVITDWEGFPANEIARLAKKDYLLVDDVNPIPISDENGDNVHWEYEVYVESNYLVGTNYKFYEDPEDAMTEAINLVKKQGAVLRAAKGHKYLNIDMMPEDCLDDNEEPYTKALKYLLANGYEID